MSESCPPLSTPFALGARPRRRDRAAREILWCALSRVRRGEIEVRDTAESVRFGRLDPDTPLRARVEVNDARFYTQVLLGGALGAGEAWIDGRWSCDDLPALVRILLRNPDCMGELDGPLARLLATARDASARFRRNTRSASRRQIAAHYDLGNEFFRRFLDPTLTYSCGVFERPDATMEDASRAKIDRLCRWLELRPEDHLLEIGTGWGAFAIHAARHYGCRVTTTTLSAEQATWARRRVGEAGLEERVEVLETDYRDLRGRYDKLVSVEMIEAVGHAHLETWFRRCASLLAPDGLMAVQSIVIADRHYESARRHQDFIKRYIFPGGCLPSLEVIGRHVGRSTDLRVRRVEDITAHYAETLRRWRRDFHASSAAIRDLGYPDEFLRMWDFYLAYCEGGFEERHIATAQMLLAGPEWRESSPCPSAPQSPAIGAPCSPTVIRRDTPDRRARTSRVA